MNKVSQLHGWIGLRLEDLKERLDIDGAFETLGIENDIDSNTPATLFELVEMTVEIPGSRAQEPEIDAASDTEFDEAEAAAESEEDLVTQEVEGNLSSDEYARLALPILVEHVLQQTDNVMKQITYQELAERLGRHNKHGDPWPRGLGQVLGRVTALIEQVGAQCLERPPFLTCVVVLSSGTNAGLPGAGISNEWPGYESLPRKDKEAKLMNEYERILSYGSRWNELLRLAELPEVAPGPDQGQPRTGGWGGGESEPHKALKRFVLEHPEVCDAPEDCWLRETEHALRSGDGIDVIFKSDRLWVGVEVKSRVSDGNLEDYLRGLYQVVKYRADEDTLLPSNVEFLAHSVRLDNGVALQLVPEYEDCDARVVNHRVAILSPQFWKRSSSGLSLWKRSQNQLLTIEATAIHDGLLKDARDDRAADTEAKPRDDPEVCLADFTTQVVDKFFSLCLGPRRVIVRSSRDKNRSPLVLVLNRFQDFCYLSVLVNVGRLDTNAQQLAFEQLLFPLPILEVGLAFARILAHTPQNAMMLPLVFSILNADAAEDVFKIRVGETEPQEQEGL